jgi:hypothetical protein
MLLDAYAAPGTRDPGLLKPHNHSLGVSSGYARNHGHEGHGGIGDGQEKNVGLQAGYKKEGR